MTYPVMPLTYKCPHCSTRFNEPTNPYSGLEERTPPVLTDGHRFERYTNIPFFCGECGKVLWRDNLQPIESRAEGWPTLEGRYL